MPSAENNLHYDVKISIMLMDIGNINKDVSNLFLLWNDFFNTKYIVL